MARKKGIVCDFDIEDLKLMYVFKEEGYPLDVDKEIDFSFELTTARAKKQLQKWIEDQLRQKPFETRKKSTIFAINCKQIKDILAMTDNQVYLRLSKLQDGKIINIFKEGNQMITRIEILENDIVNDAWKLFRTLHIKRRARRWTP